MHHVIRTDYYECAPWQRVSVRLGNQQPNHMHHMLTGGGWEEEERQRQGRSMNKSLYALELIQIKTDPHALIKRKRRSANEKKDLLWYSRISFSSRHSIFEQQQIYRINLDPLIHFLFSILSFQLSSLAATLGIFHICTVFILQNDVIKIKMRSNWSLFVFW